MQYILLDGISPSGAVWVHENPLLHIASETVVSFGIMFQRQLTVQLGLSRLVAQPSIFDRAITSAMQFDVVQQHG
jgi:hypothetical protein